MLQRVSIASIVACLVAAWITQKGFTQTADRGSVMVPSPRQGAKVDPRSSGIVYTDDCQTCGPLVGGDASEGAWEWVRDPLQQKRRAVRIYNQQCVRCHGVNGRGVWDIPDVPDFTDGRWQMSRSDADIVRLTLGGRGACMPAFKGTITRAEACAITGYIRTFAQPPAERPASGRSARLAPSRVTPSNIDVTKRPTPRARTNVASRPNAFEQTKSKNPLTWINPFSKKKQSSVRK